MQPSSRQILLIVLILLSVFAILLHLKWLWTAKYRNDSIRGEQMSITRNVIKAFIERPPMRKPTPLMMKKLNAATYSLEDLRDMFFVEVLRVHEECSRLIRVGRQGDGGWDVCMSKGYTLRPGCLVYSFGVGGIWEFDEQMSGKYNCTVRAFDPTMNKPEHIHTPGKVFFYPLGIGGQPNVTDKFRSHNLKAFLEMFKDNKKTLDIVKIDVEYSEWDSLESIIKDGLLSSIKQIFLEYHTKEVTGKRSEAKDYRRYLTIMQTLEREGFRKFRATRNHGALGVYRGGLTVSERAQEKHQQRSCCYEVYYVNTAFSTTKKESDT